MRYSTQQLRCDVVVAGSGIGGLTAARTAIDHGASVVVIEKASEIGGSAAVSGGGAFEKKVSWQVSLAGLFLRFYLYLQRL